MAPIEVPTGAAGSGGAGATGAGRRRQPGGRPAATGTTGRRRHDRGAGPRRRDAGDRCRRLARSRPDRPVGRGRSPASTAPAGSARDHGIGSNDWVVAPSKSATGHALLANDPHLGLGMPSVWFMNGLHCRVVEPGLPVRRRRGQLPGRPGRHPRPQRADRLGRHERRPRRRRTCSSSRSTPTTRPTTCSRASRSRSRSATRTIKVAGGERTSTFDVRSTGHGPIDQRRRATGSRPSAASTRCAGPRRPSRTASSTRSSASTQAGNCDDVPGRPGALRRAVPELRLRRRRRPHRLPGPGPRPDPPGPGGPGRPAGPGLGPGTHEWTGYVKYDDLPRLFDPPAGIIATANDAAVDARFPYFLGREWDPGYRVGRITELLDGRRREGRGDPRRDERDPDGHLRRARAARHRPHSARSSRRPTTDGRVLARIQAWNGHCDLDSTGCAAYMTFEYHLLRGLFDRRARARRRPRLRRRHGQLAGAHRPARPAGRTPGGTTRGRRRRRPKSSVVTAAVDAAGRTCARRTATRPAGRGAASTRSRSRRATLGESGLPVSPGTSTPGRSRSRARPARSTTPTPTSRPPTRTRPTPRTRRAACARCST